MAVPNERKDERSIGQLLKELTHETSTLLKQEVDLAKTEMSEKASRVGTNLGAVAMGGSVALLGAIALLLAVIYGLGAILNNFLSPETASWLAPLIVGGILAAVGYSMIKKALDTLKRESLTPQRTTQSLQENKEWLKEKIS
ncbi:MAG TPA: phage holin family protein [Thermoanaerobaculia bacterium]|jgi:putative Mn2+ efflux pump MntP|nr:phage holin family protein [Thermoanaerobaculia bacterium]